jgi:hypothetical protein
MALTTSSTLLVTAGGLASGATAACADGVGAGSVGVGIGVSVGDGVGDKVGAGLGIGVAVDVVAGAGSARSQAIISNKMTPNRSVVASRHFMARVYHSP